MENDIIVYLILIIILAILLLVYSVYVIIDERKKMKYYYSNLLYVTDWDKFSTMVKKQKRIIRKKKIQLFFLTIMVKIKTSGNMSRQKSRKFLNNFSLTK